MKNVLALLLLACCVNSCYPSRMNQVINTFPPYDLLIPMDGSQSESLIPFEYSELDEEEEILENSAKE